MHGETETAQRVQHTSPEFASNAQVLATPHEGVALASFCGGRNAGGVEIFVFASSYGYKPTETVTRRNAADPKASYRP